MWICDWSMDSHRHPASLRSCEACLETTISINPSPGHGCARRMAKGENSGCTVSVIEWCVITSIAVLWIVTDMFRINCPEVDVSNSCIVQEPGATRSGHTDWCPAIQTS